MAKSFKKLRDKMSTEARGRVDRRVRETLLEMTLQELRQKVSGKTQAELAELLEVTQGAISQLEGRHDILLSRLTKYVRALGGDLELIARFPDADVRITQFDGNDEESAATAS
ncbi:MAG: helix-turn-helix transcriptional regulator [Deltaproteobacteria bacterium]|nr:helix-turn-helix transcriptional regulator [Deltaproteobacteria bacterium]MBW2496370.1 helix-turn-helix transcriptional regulator [Deltaproteobacteria bacterium]